MALSAIALLSPVGLDLIHSAFLAGEQLARSIGQAVLLIALAVMAVIITLEWLVRVLIFKRRARGATSA